MQRAILCDDIQMPALKSKSAVLRDQITKDHGFTFHQNLAIYNVHKQNLAITTGMMFLMASSGRMTPIEEMPTPLFAVPYAAPRSAAGE